jgi:heme-degrading monooxygenase HmoA
MFGTIAKLKFKPGSFEKMQETMSAREAQEAKGFVSTTVYRSQSEPDVVWLAVVFEDEASYRANAADPRTDEMAGKMRELMAAAPEWNDGEVVSVTRAGDRASA